MKGRELIDEASFDISTRTLLSRAFDRAWAVLAKYHSPLAIKAARLKLANIVVSLAREGEREADRLADCAVRTFLVDDP